MKRVDILTDSPLLQRIQEKVPEFDCTPYLKVTDMKTITITSYRELIEFIKTYDQLSVDQYNEVFNGYVGYPPRSMVLGFIDASKGAAKMELSCDKRRKKSIEDMIAWLETHGEKVDTVPGYCGSFLLLFR